MLWVLSPAKTLDFESPLTPAFAALEAQATRPLFAQDAAELVEQLRGFSEPELAAFMEISPALAALNAARFQRWRPRATARNSRAALAAFNGDVYEGLQAASLDDDDLRWAQSHLRILSGLYGVLRPLDRLQPYRLEMGRRLATARGASLYDWWGDRVALALNRQGRGQPLVNLASQEYFRVLQTPALKLPVLTLSFEEVDAQGRARVIGLFAKRARGLMARFAIDHRVDRAEDLKAFRAEGYAWSAARSTPERWVFVRHHAEGSA